MKSISDLTPEQMAEIERIYPQEWSLPNMELALRVGFQLKLLGLDFHTNDELAALLAELHASGYVEQNGFMVRWSRTRHVLLGEQALPMAEGSDVVH